MRTYRKSGTAALAAVAVAVGVVAGVTLGASPSGAFGTAPPWVGTDSNEAGGLEFFNAAGTQILGGNLLDGPPVAAYAVGTTILNLVNTKATLYAYLPNSSLAPGAWSGEALSASTAFPNASAPAPLNTTSYPVETGQSDDLNLADLVESFPNNSAVAGYSGAYELRLKSSGGGTNPTHYDYADITVANVTESSGVVTGGTWSVTYTPDPTNLATTTTIDASTPTTATDIAPVTLTADVSPKVPGTVQFFDGATAIGAAQPVSAGSASISTTLPAGTDNITATYTPATFSGIASSTSASYPITVTHRLLVTTTSLPSVAVDVVYPATTLTATGGTGALTWSAGTALPPGLKLAAAGKITGTPTTVGTFSVTVNVHDAAKPTQHTGTATLSVVIAPMTIATTALPAGLIDKAYTATLTATGGKKTLVWSVVGSLPAGLKIATSGKITGTPTVSGTFPITVEVHDATKPTAYTASANLSITIAPMTISTASLPNATVGKAYTAKFAVSGGKSAYTWTVLSGPIPPGLKLSAGGAFSGKPTAAGVYTFTVQVADASKPTQNIATGTFTITVT